ncbi:glycine betaine ABC transporter substrate-binding protein [Methanohalophilus euhalobius]|uniref:Glycine betaine ABC transporter substrate-binding protein n=1 Tax=Methanohalophilus euhalobius TaxID=51203 RepID=A0A314ZWR5_9EURY|nr:glycine betaine ABC transporter substrate-binding protein [Methanohalophilus euhalobius]PQV42953.1 glycine betaine/proline transport system substrate-binding protein [Methanohalophilus euhalobius]RNI10381.1 glycine betaine ABC transporter substrate-binding protein [Methanohalophilus euhalobius]
MDNKYKAVIVGILLVLSLFAAGCAQQGDEGNEGAGDGNQTQVEDKSVTIAYVQWASAVATTNVVQEVFQKAGYEVELNNVAAGIMYQAIANGDADFSVCAWLPNTQSNYWEQYGDQIEKVNVNTPNVKTGLVVPQYVDIDTIPELKGNESMFGGTITGIDPGAGIMSQTEKAIQEYGLDGYTLQASSGPGMTSALASAIADEEPIIVTLWNPHWAFARWDLKYLDDPKDTYGADNIVTIGRPDLKEDKPQAYEILTRFNWTVADNEQVMSYIDQGMSEEEAAEKWVNDNPEQVNAWIGEGE